MNISKIYVNLTNKAKIFTLPKKQATEVKELYNDMLQNTPYKNISVKKIDKDIVRITGDECNSNSISIDLNFKNNEQIQVEKSKGYVLRPYLPYNNTTQIIKGNIGGPVKRIKTTNIATNSGNSDYIKSIYYENCISGNAYRREETTNGVKFYKRVNGDFEEMFKK